MTLTVVVGSSGSGKTTFLNDTTTSHKCTYIRQYHNLRPYITVSKIPNFEPHRLPYWDIYVKEETADAIQVGGTMAGEFTAGLSGGQRKLLLFELICQRTAHDENLLLVFDEPFSGVTDDFVPFIVDRLNVLREQHNILLVTNDHVDTLKTMADNTIVVSAVDRSTVQINGLTKVSREKAILALAVGDPYVAKSSSADLKFFFDVEVASNGAIMGVAAFTIFAFGMFLLTFWDSASTSGALVIVAASIIAFFCLNPYLLALVDWRNFMREEAEALLHSSIDMNNTLKSLLTLMLILAVSLIEWGVVNAVIEGYGDIKYWWAMLMDNASLTFPFIFLGLYTNLSFQAVEIYASLPFLFMIFFSTTFSPGSGVAGLKELRYLFARFYFWCMIPEVENSMDGCPPSDVNLVYLTLSALLGLFLFMIYQIIEAVKSTSRTKHLISKNNKLKDAEFRDLQIELYGEDKVRESMPGSNHSASRGGSRHSSRAITAPIPSRQVTNACLLASRDSRMGNNGTTTRTRETTSLEVSFGIEF